MKYLFFIAPVDGLRIKSISQTSGSISGQVSDTHSTISGGDDVFWFGILPTVGLAWDF